jgi:hypothetical protein
VTSRLMSITKVFAVYAYPRGCVVLRRGSAAVRLLGLRFRIRPAAWLSVYCKCCVLCDKFGGEMRFYFEFMQAPFFQYYRRLEAFMPLLVA